MPVSLPVQSNTDRTVMTLKRPPRPASREANGDRRSNPSTGPTFERYIPASFSIDMPALTRRTLD